MKRVFLFFKHIYRWFTDQEYQQDINYRRWGVRTSEIEGSHCGCCGHWIEGDSGDPNYPPDRRWTICKPCAA